MVSRLRCRFFSLASFAVIICFATLAGNAFADRSNIAVGQKAIAFHAKTISNKTINFPGDYKGKIVLLNFWATWCPSCRAEMPRVLAAYNKFHDQGFEVVSVSLEKSESTSAVLKFVKDNNITWPQIYDGGYLDSVLAAQYGVNAIPCPVLVDGDTGVIIATDSGALGSHLTKAVETALAAKAQKISVAEKRTSKVQGP
jgi:peroxiredoxin